ncbi:hypothetical protein [Microbulbifer sp. PAAF003]
MSLEKEIFLRLVKEGVAAIMRATSSKIGNELAGIRESVSLHESPKKSC